MAEREKPIIATSSGVKDVITKSRVIAIELNQDYIGVEHILLAILKYYHDVPLSAYTDSSGYQLLSSSSVSMPELERKIRSIAEVKNEAADKNQTRSMPLDKHLENVLKLAYNEAALTSSSEVNIAVLLLSILKSIDGSPKIRDSLYEYNLNYDKALSLFLDKNNNINIARERPITQEASFSFTVPATPISLYFDLDEFDANEISEIIYELSILYESIGGDKLEIKGMQNLEYVKFLLPA